VYLQSFTAAAEADFLTSFTAGLKGVKFHDIIYRTFRHILYTLVSSKAAPPSPGYSNFGSTPEAVAANTVSEFCEPMSTLQSGFLGSGTVRAFPV
jgi:hypothetical protein